MGIYALVADVRARTEVPDAAPPSDAALEELIADAEDLVDRLVGPRRSSSDTGRKFAPANLSTAAADALKRSTVELAVASYLDPEAFDPPAGKSVSGPDFSISDGAGATPRAQRVLRAAAGRLDAQGLRTLTARASG